MTEFRGFRFVTCALAATLVVGGCATRRVETQLAPMPVSPSIVWRVAEGDQLRVRLYREPDLSGETTVNQNGSAYFTGLGRVPVEGLSLDSLQVMLTNRYGKLIVDPAVDVVLERSLVVYGQARAPGIYAVDPSTTVLGLLSRAGGAQGSSRAPRITLVKADGRQFALPREARLSTMDISRSDAVYVTEDSFFARNQQTLSNASVFVSVLTSAVSLFFIFSHR